MDTYRLDSHKLHYHVQRVADWLKGELVYPIYMEISPSGACNHRCIFCAQDFVGYQPRFLDTSILKTRITEMGRLGLRSVMYAGEGEPFLHKDIADIIIHTKRSGIDVALTTNGVLMKKEISEEILDHVEWIKISCNAGSPETYAGIHVTKPIHFEMVMRNIEDAANIRQKNGYKCVLGVQTILLPDNCHELTKLAEKARDVGADYLVVKPYSQHLKSNTCNFKNIKYAEYEYIADQLHEFNTDSFNVITRLQTMRNWDAQAKPYNRCYALSFWSHLDAGGNIWGCSNYLGEEPFNYGSIYEKSFQEIWEGEKRMLSLKWVENELDSQTCRVNCRMDKVNHYLWELKNPPKHVNFI